MPSILYKDKIYGGVNTAMDADHVDYDNTDSGLTATNTQDAIDELNSNKEPLLSNGLKSGSNIDSLKSNGFYWLRKTETTGTQPGYDFYFLIVCYASYAEATLQIAYNMSSSAHKSRMYVNSNWSTWG